MRYIARCGAALSLFAILFGISHVGDTTPKGSSSHTASMAGPEGTRIDWP
ncbi:hypothetical protein [Streptomyces sp. NBC_00996]|nr:hypothetical protein OG390_26165 [Streptomyces sp. NBC_00996]